MPLSKLKVEVEGGGQYLVALNYATVVAAERHFKKPISELEGGMEGLTWMAHHHLKFTGTQPNIGNYDTWLATITDLSLISPEGTSENPTEPPVETESVPPALPS